MKYFILTLSLFHFAFVFSQEDWVKLDFNDSTFIEFPEKPLYKKHQGQDLYTFMDSTGTYQVLRLEMELGADIQKEAVETRQFYSEFVRGLMDGAKGKIMSLDYVDIDGYIGVDCTYSLIPNGMELLCTSRIIALNDTIYSISYTYLEGEWEKNKAYRKRFLNSANIN